MYSYDAIVRYSETGGRKTSSMATIANYFQDCAILQSEEVGIGLDYLAEHNRAWFLISWQILEAVFGFDNESNDSTIITHIKNIRAKFADYDYTPIKTVWGIGYKWEE